MLPQTITAKGNHMAPPSKTTPKAKPAKRVDRRKTTSTRIKAEVRELLEEAAAQSGRSIAQEMELRLELSLAEDEAFGGSQFRALFGLLGKAANVIEQQTGKSYFGDWDTAVAVRAAWRRLIAGFGPGLPDEYIAAFEQALAAPIPKFPIFLAPIPPGLPGLSMGAQNQYEQQCKDYDAAVVVYEEESAVWDKECEASRRNNETTLAQMALGKDVALSLLPKRAKKKA